jgi:hypothetical protein
MSRTDRLVLFALFAYIAALLYGRFQERNSAPSPGFFQESTIESILRAERQLPDLSHGRVGDFEISVRGSRRMQFSGTAWAAGGAGLWVSARHTVQRNCDQIWVGDAGPQPRILETIHPDADVLSFRAHVMAEALPIADRAPAVGDRAFAVGFPQARAGAAHLSLRGKLLVRMIGWVTGEKPFYVYYWNVERYVLDLPDPTDHRGLSGSPVIGPSGQVIGVHIGGDRRNRATSVSLSDLRRVLGPTEARRANPLGTPEQFDAAAADMLRRGSGAKGLLHGLMECDPAAVFQACDWGPDRICDSSLWCGAGAYCPRCPEDATWTYPKHLRGC